MTRDTNEPDYAAIVAAGLADPDPAILATGGDPSALERLAADRNADEDATRDMWARWIIGYTPAAFFDAFMRTAQGALSRCTQCGETIALDIREGGGVPDWGMDGDYGCWASPDTGEDGTGGHVAEGTEA